MNDKRDLTIFMLFGGHAVIEKSLAQEFFPELIAPREAAYSHVKGFLVVSSLPKQILQHAPTRKLRMKTIKRDGYRCRVCGRSAANNVDIELHVHHIFPWGKGRTQKKKTSSHCVAHATIGLEPHFEFELFSLIGIDPVSDRLRDAKAKYFEGLKHYQRIAHQGWRELEEAPSS